MVTKQRFIMPFYTRQREIESPSFMCLIDELVISTPFEISLLWEW